MGGGQNPAFFCLVMGSFSWSHGSSQRPFPPKILRFASLGSYCFAQAAHRRRLGFNNVTSGGKNAAFWWSWDLWEPPGVNVKTPGEGPKAGFFGGLGERERVVR